MGKDFYLALRKIGGLKVGEVMRKKFFKASGRTSCKDVFKELRKSDVSVIPVISNGKFVGEIHEISLLKLVIDPKSLSTREIGGFFGSDADMSYFATKASELMKRHDYRVSVEDTVSDAVKLMIDSGINSIPVMKGDKLVGIVTELDILNKVFGSGGKR